MPVVRDTTKKIQLILVKYVIVNVWNVMDQIVMIVLVAKKANIY